MPNRSTLVIAGIWVLTIWASIGGGTSLPLHSDFPREMTMATTVTILLMPVLFFGVMSFWMPHSPFYSPIIARFVDARFGENSFSTFLVRLKPLLMFAVAAGVHGLFGIWQATRSELGSGAYTIYGFFISGGIGFALVHAVLYFRKATGVYPSPNPASSTPTRRQPLPLREALRRYWWTLIGLGAFPTVLFVLGESYRVPFEYFALPFFAVGLLAGWPYFSGRAPFSFCLVLGAVWLTAGVVGALIAQFMRTAVAGG